MKDSYPKNTVFKNILHLLRVFSIVLLVVTGSPAQTIQTPFGKNRVQYHDDFDSWWMYETDNFVTFWYGKGRNIAKSVMQLAELDHRELEKILAHSMNEKIRIIIYLDHSDYAQTNIAYFDSKEAGGAGLAQFYDNKVIVYFDGDHQHLRKQIRTGIVQAYLKSMFSGISIQEIYQNLVSSDLPNWYIAGLIDYLTEKWPASVQQDLEWFFTEEPRKVKNFASFSKNYPLLAGHSMWHFLADQYGDQAISDFLYLVRIHNDIKKAFKYVYNLDSHSMYRDWYNFYENYFEQNKWLKGPLEKENNSIREFDHPVTKVLLDKDAGSLYYVTNNYGRIKLRKRDLDSGKEETLLKYGYKNKHQLTDEHYPIMNFDPNTGHLGIIYEKKDQLYFRDLDMKSRQFIEVLFPVQVQRIYDFAYEESGFLLFTGSLDGFTDVYLFNLEKRQTEALTENYFDEISLLQTNDSIGDYILSGNFGDFYIKSAAYDSFPPTNNFDVYKVQQDFNQAINLTKTENSNEKQAVLLNKDDLLVLTDAYGRVMPQLWNQKDSVAVAQGLIGSSKGILHHDFKAGKYVYVYRSEFDRWVIGNHDDVLSDIETPTNLGFELKDQDEISVKNKETEEDNLWIEIDEALLFQTEFNDPGQQSDNLLNDFQANSNVMEFNAGQDLPNELPVFNRSQAVASRLRFNFTELITRVDNQALFEGLETFDQYNESYSPPPAGFLVKSTVRDLFEDHVIEGGIRMASDFRGMEYFISYDDLKRKWDWKYALYRKTNSRYENVIASTPESDKLRNRTHLGMIKAKYPFDNYRSIHFTGMLRYDQTIVTASGPESLDAPDIGFQRIILGAEYVFDNTSEKAANLLSGTRYKAFAKFSNRFLLSFYDPFTFHISEGIMGVAGFDARHYVDLLKHSTLAFRMAGQSSFGSEQNIYFLGGVENWFFSKTDDSYPIPPDGSYAFKVQAGNMRGFPYNVRNGSTFIVANAELRIPVFSYLYNGHIKNSMIRDFQLTGFFDLGMAWYGITPFSEKNIANVYYLEAPPAVLLKIKQLKDPLVGGMGFGVRTSVFGYFLKVDYAWGIESGKILDPVLYFSMGYDF